jgi:hypothetical protein
MICHEKSYRLPDANAYVQLVLNAPKQPGRFLYAILRLMTKWAERLLRLLVVLAALTGLLYAGDWAVLRGRVSRGTAFGVVQVNQLLATPLKGNKVEYDLMGTVQTTCSHSIFPQQGNPACWWLERHPTQWE